MTHGVPKNPKLCTKCGRKPRRSPDQRWCLDCQRIANRKSRRKTAKRIRQLEAFAKRYGIDR